MKKLLSFFLLVLMIASFASCDENITKIDDAEPGVSVDDGEITSTYIVIEATDDYLLVSDIGEDGKAVEGSQYGVSNVFYPDTKIGKGDKIIVVHNGQIMESYPAVFSKIYKMCYRNPETGRSVEVVID